MKKILTIVGLLSISLTSLTVHAQSGQFSLPVQAAINEAKLNDEDGFKKIALGSGVLLR